MAGMEGARRDLRMLSQESALLRRHGERGVAGPVALQQPWSVSQLATLLLGLLGLSAVTFSKLAEDVAGRESIVTFDSTVADWLHAHAVQTVTEALGGVTELGGTHVIVGVALVTASVLLLGRAFAQAAFVGAAVAGGEGLNFLLKAAFERPRPSFAEPLATAGGFSFPSGHAMMSLIVYGALAGLIAARLRPGRARVFVFASATVLVLLIGFSRVYLGVHYASDVLAAYSAGLAWLTMCGLVLVCARLRPRQEAHDVRRVGLERGGVLAAEAAEGLERHLTAWNAPGRRGASTDQGERTEQTIDGDHVTVGAQQQLA
jgi:membrane-associated phospholipid phosphatase